MLKNMEHIRSAFDKAIKERIVPDWEAFAREHGEGDAEMLAHDLYRFDPRWCDCPEETKVWINETLARAAREYLEALKAKAQAKPQPQPDYPEGRELDCGHVVYYKTDVMRASLGTVCPDCYDDPRWSG